MSFFETLDGPQSLHKEQIFAGRYRVLKLLGRGGMGAVYEVEHLETGGRRALKVLLPNVLNEEMKARFRQEARLAAYVESEHVVSVSDAGIDAATEMPFLVMELLRGEEVGKRLERTGPFPLDEALRVLRETALALDKMHAKRIVHRDLKPANLFLAERDEGPPKIKLLDFGVAKVLASSSTGAGTTRSVGTPLYMSPEQFRELPITPAVDIYALGMIAYTLLVGQAYFAEEAARFENMFVFAINAMKGTIEPATGRAARAGVTLPPGFDDWFRGMTAAEPTARPTSATAAIGALFNAVGVDPSSFGPAPRSSLPEIAARGSSAGPEPSTQSSLARSQARTSPKRGRVAATLLVVAVVFVGAGLWVRRVQHESEALRGVDAGVDLDASRSVGSTLPAIVPSAAPLPEPATTAALSVDAAPPVDAAPDASPSAAATSKRPIAAPRASASAPQVPFYSRD